MTLLMITPMNPTEEPPAMLSGKNMTHPELAGVPRGFFLAAEAAGRRRQCFMSVSLARLAANGKFPLSGVRRVGNVSLVEIGDLLVRTPMGLLAEDFQSEPVEPIYF